MTDPEKIITATAQVYGVRVEDIMSVTRRRKYSEPRQMAMFLCHERTNLDMTDIGIVFGRERTTVIHDIHRISGLLDVDRKTQECYKWINEKL